MKKNNEKMLVNYLKRNFNGCVFKKDIAEAVKNGIQYFENGYIENDVEDIKVNYKVEYGCLCIQVLVNGNDVLQTSMSLDRVKVKDSEKPRSLSQTFFFTTEVGGIRMHYTQLTEVVNEYNGDVIIYPSYLLDGEEVRMDGIKGNSPAIYVAIMDSVIKYCEAAGEDKDTEKAFIDALCGILRLSNDRKEAIADLNECADAFDIEPEKSHIEDAQAALMDYLPVFYDTTESAYGYYCDIMRLSPDAELSEIRYAFHSLVGAMSFLPTLAKSNVEHCIEMMASATFRDVNRVEVAKNVVESLRFSMDGIRDFSDTSRSEIESLVLALDAYIANPDRELWIKMWKHIIILRDNLFNSFGGDKEICATITEACATIKDTLKKFGLTY